MLPLVDDLHERCPKARLGGGEERIARLHEQGKLTARERLDLPLDEGSFTELGVQAGIHDFVRGLEGREAPAGDHRLRARRRPAGDGVRLRLHGDGRLNGHDRRDEVGPPCPTWR